MLYLDQPIGPLRGLMIYRDHEDKGLFYYGKDSPRLSLINGRPEFMFLKYRRDITDNPDFQEGDVYKRQDRAWTVHLRAIMTWSDVERRCEETKPSNRSL